MTDISRLIDQLSAADAVERASAAKQLCRHGDESRAAAVPLVRVCGDADADVREWAVAALEEMGPPAADDGDALAALLQNHNADVGYWAATLLGRLKAAAAPQTHLLAAALADESANLSVRQRAAWALGQIGPQAAGASAALKQTAQSNDARLARLAANALTRIGS